MIEVSFGFEVFTGNGGCPGFADLRNFVFEGSRYGSSEDGLTLHDFVSLINKNTRLEFCYFSGKFGIYNLDFIQVSSFQTGTTNVLGVEADGNS